MKARVSALFERVFVEREFFLRADGKVQYLRLSPKLQVTTAGIVAAGALWLLYASVNVVFHNQIVAGKVDEIERQKLAYFDLLTEVSEYHEQFTRITANLEQNQNFLLSLLDRAGGGGEELAEFELQLKDSATERARVRVSRQGLADRLSSFRSELNSIAGGSAALRAKADTVLAAFEAGGRGSAELAGAEQHLGQTLDRIARELNETEELKTSLEARLAALNGKLAQSESAREGLELERERLERGIGDLQANMAKSSERQSELEQQIAILESSLDDSLSRNASLNREKSTLNTRIAGLELRLFDMRDAQQAIVARLTEQTMLGIDGYEQAVEMTGIEVDDLLNETPQVATLGEDQGGPFIPGDYVIEDDPIQSLHTSIAVLDLQMDRWKALQDLIESMPMDSPMDSFRVTSKYGPRRDPVNGRKSNHWGLDMGGRTGTPVFAPAPGRVVFAGWKGRYGRVIDIDHGHGVRTRYAHLRKILVKRGQEVGRREKIALVGSSGRSTGPHLHYEVKVHGRPYDPMKFLKAGQHVLQAQRPAE